MKRPSDVIFWVLAVGVLILALVIVLKAGSHSPSGGRTGGATTAARASPRSTQGVSSTVARGVARPPQITTTTRTTTTAQTPTSTGTAAVARVQIVAARGPSWISAHAASPNGKVLFEGTLDLGRSVAVAARRVWLRLGAAANVDVRVNGKLRTVPAGTVDIVLNP